MKDILMMMMADCPYCRQADEMIAELTAKHPEYAKLNIKRVDEKLEPDFADTLDYYYVPCFFVGDEKLMEGVPSMEKVKAVLDAASGNN